MERPLYGTYAAIVEDTNRHLDWQTKRALATAFWRKAVQEYQSHLKAMRAEKEGTVNKLEEALHG